MQIISAALAEPGRPFPGPLHYPLVFVMLAWCLTLIQDNSFHGRGPQRVGALHGVDLLTNQSSLSTHLAVTETTKHVLLL